ncbi:MAG: hydrogenase expression/formation protein [Betaproteobacteria bacterium]|nr:hydrogenase expression/formation protein [Betaproteobacteria bacterium]
MKSFPIPVVATGPGSHPPEDEGLEFLSMPKAEPLVNPIPPEDAAPGELAAAADVVEQLLESMQGFRPGNGSAPRFSLKAMAPGALRALNESLGQGEVSAVVGSGNGTAGWHVQETAFAGVWRVQREDGRGGLAEDILEADDMPAVLKEAAAQAKGARLDVAQLPEGVMNAPSIVNELRHHAGAFRPGRPAHVVNLSLLPLSRADHEGLDAMLGEGSVAILSRGFGNCRITSTRAQGVWRVRYFNTMNTLILDTFEVVNIPEAARAAVEDIEDSQVRLRDLLAWLREG